MTTPTMKTYLAGNWGHIFSGTTETDCRIIVDPEARKIVAMEIAAGMGYEQASEDEMADLADSLFNANSEALDDPEEWGLVQISLPTGTFALQSGVGPLPGATELQRRIESLCVALEDTLPVVLNSFIQAKLDPRDSGLVAKIDSALRMARDGKGDAAGLLDALYQDAQDNNESEVTDLPGNH